jgi:BMFP domain-containing protein YqiC
MRDNRKLIDDMLALSGNILGNLLGARHEMKAQAKQRLDSLTRQLDLVTRREFDAAFAMLAKARTMQEELAERLTAVEAKLNLSSKSGIKPQPKRRLPSFKKSNHRRKRG